jgi:hypothetical protein
MGYCETQVDLLRWQMNTQQTIAKIKAHAHAQGYPSFTAFLNEARVSWSTITGWSGGKFNPSESVVKHLLSMPKAKRRVERRGRPRKVR